MKGGFVDGAGKKVKLLVYATADERTHIKMAAKLVRRGRRVLIVDMDTQGNATSNLQLTEVPSATVADTICRTSVENLDLIRDDARGLTWTGKAEVSLKGKICAILLPIKLCRSLLKYTGRQRISSGELFRTRGGRPLSMKHVWAEMKGTCEKAGVARSKVVAAGVAVCVVRHADDVPGAAFGAGVGVFHGRPLNRTAFDTAAWTGEWRPPSAPPRPREGGPSRRRRGHECRRRFCPRRR